MNDLICIFLLGPIAIVHGHRSLLSLSFSLGDSAKIILNEYGCIL